MNVLAFALPEGAKPAGMWPEPVALPSMLPPVPAFHPQLLPAKLRDWACDISDRMKVPLDLVGTPAMVAAGSLIGCRVGIRPEARTDWTEVGNLWGCVVAPPGAMKSPAMAQVLAPIMRLEDEAARENALATAEFKKALGLHKLHKDAADQRARKELKEGKVEAAAAILAEVEEPVEPMQKRFLTTDATFEKLGEICAGNPRGVLVHRDELLTLFADLDREEKAAARGFYLSAWGGSGAYTFDRIGRGTIRLPSVNVSLMGTTQPQRIAAYLRHTLQNKDDGMAQRLQLLSWPDFSKDWEPMDEYPNVEAKTAAFACYTRLSSLNAESAGAERDRFDDGSGVPFLRFAPEALEAFGEFRQKLEQRVRGDELAPYMQAHLSKYRGLIPRLSLISHLASGGSGPVSLDACLSGLAWGEYLEAHAVRAYASLTTANTDVANAILRRIKKGDIQNGFTDRDIYRRGWSNLTDREQVSAALTLLQDYDWLQSERRNTGGRPSTIWWINPAVLP